MSTPYYFEDMPVGFRYATGSREITLDAIRAFATEWDPQPFHLDEAAAAKTHFGTIAASGWHTLMVAFRLLVDAGIWNEASLGASGMDDVRWFKPVYPGAVLHCENEVIFAERSKSRPHMGRMKVRTEVIDQNGERVAGFTSLALVRTRS